MDLRDIEDWEGLVDWTGCAEVERIPGKVSGAPIINLASSPTPSSTTTHVQRARSPSQLCSASFLSRYRPFLITPSKS
jgi:hypothetical protein